MSASDPEATTDYSKSGRGRTGSGGAGADASGPLTAVLAGLALAGAILCVAATFSPVIRIEVLGVEKASYSGYDRHSVALLVIAAFAIPMLLGALRDAGPAMGALAVLGLVVIGIAVLGDLPDLDQTGPIGELFQDARARAAAGYYLETLAGVLLLVSGAAFLVLRPTGRSADA